MQVHGRQVDVSSQTYRHNLSRSIPRVLWVYSISPEAAADKVGEVFKDNHLHYAKLSGFKVRYITDSNFMGLLTSSKAERLQKSINDLKKRVEERSAAHPDR